MDLIKREDAIMWFEPYADRGLKIPVETVIQNLKDIPSAENKGEWIFVGNSIEPMWECSECGEKEFGNKSELTKYCPECGCRMKGADNE